MVKTVIISSIVVIFGMYVMALFKKWNREDMQEKEHRECLESRGLK